MSYKLFKLKDLEEKEIVKRLTKAGYDYKINAYFPKEASSPDGSKNRAAKDILNLMKKEMGDSFVLLKDNGLL